MTTPGAGRGGDDVLFATEGRTVGKFVYQAQAMPERCPTWAPGVCVGSDGWLPTLVLGFFLRKHWDGPWKSVVSQGRNFRIPAERAVFIDRHPDRQAAVASALELDRRIAAGDIPGSSQR